MKVSELAKEFRTTNKVVLEQLKALKLKAKDGNQELSKAALTVVRGELRKMLKESINAAKASVPKKEESKISEVSEVKEKKEKKTVKETKEKTKTPKVTKATVGVKAKKTTKKTTEKEKAPQEKPKKPAVSKAKSPAQPAAKKTETVPSEEPKKIKKTVSEAPFVALKPLPKKKRKPMSRDGGRGSRGETHEQGKDGSRARTDEQGASSQAGGMPSAIGQGVASVEHLEELELKVPIAVKDFAVRIQQKTGVVLKKLMDLGVFANINQNLGEDVVRKVAQEFGYNLVKVKTQEQQIIQGHKEEEENPDLLKPRAPVVTFMGHVDHGKTSLLDKIRRSHITDSEHGGITQHIGAYSVSLPKGRITFLDTPGHEAFTAMRARGAHITDLVVVVVAADEGVMPQTDEAIDHARAADVPIVIALNKIDRKNADIDRVKKQLVSRDLNPEDWGGKTIVVPVSAITGEGVETLLEMMLLEAELLELRANAEKKASGIVVEAHLSRGKGAVASLIVQSGTLCHNDVIVVGPYYGKVKAMFDDHERPIKEAGPSTPIEILGLPMVPDAGEMFYVLEDEKQAKEIAYMRREQIKDEKLSSTKKIITLEDLYSQIQEGTIKELNVILKADVQGSLEALRDSLEKIPSDEVKVKFIHAGVGDVNASDVILAVASNAIIIAFHVSVGPRAKEELEKQEVDVRQYRIIYDAVNDMRKALEGLLAPKIKRKFLGRVEVRQVFKLSKSGKIAGCYVVKGKIHRKSSVDVMRNGEVVHSSVIATLKRFKDDVKEVGEGYECGISVQGYDKVEQGDFLETFEIETTARTL